MSVHPTSSAPGGEVSALFARGSIYTAATALQLTAGVLVLPAITRLLTPGAYGHLATALVTLQILTYVAALGLPYAITLEYFDKRRGALAVQRLLATGAVASLAVTFLVDLFGPVWSSGLLSGVEYDLPLRLAVWAAAPTAVMLATQALLRSQNRTKAFVSVTVLGTVGAQLCGLALVVFVERSVSWYLTGMLVGLSAAAASGLAYCGVARLRLCSLDGLLSGVRLGIPTIPHAMAIYVVSAGDRIIVQRELGLEAVARYQVAYLIGALGLTLVSALNNAWAPLVYGAPNERRWSVLAETSAAVYRLAGIVVAGIAIGGPLALAVMAPGSYRSADTTTVTGVVSLSTIVYVAYFANAHVIFHSRRARSLAWATPLSAALNIGMNLVLIPRFGLIGAAYATVACYGTQALLASRIRRRITGVQWVSGAATRAGALAVAAVLASALVPADGTWLVLRAVVAGGLVVLFGHRVRDLVRRSSASAPVRAQGGPA